VARAVAGALPRADRARRGARLIGSGPSVDRLLRLGEVSDPAQRERLVGRAEAEAEAERQATAAAIVADVAGQGPLAQALYLDSHLFLPDRLLICADKMSMAASVEQRVPYLDLELMRFVERIPVGLRASARAGKTLHRQAIEPLVPRSALDRPKHGFSTPYDDWLRASLGDEVRRRYAQGSAVGDLVAPAEVARLVDDHRRGRSDNKNLLYCLLELSEWHRAFVEGERAPAVAVATG
jgi:asparagine synthase (glutamine-hydrolysing)